MPTKASVLKLLRATTFPQNTGRKNNLQPGQKYSLSMVLGQSKLMYCSKAKDKGRQCRRPSRHNKKYAELLVAARQLLKAHAPNYAFHSVTVNMNQRSAKHTDKFNTGFSYIIGLGNYKGGELVFEDGPHKGSHNIKNRWLKFKGDHVHYNTAFTGERYTLVYYHWS